jgi:acetylornithine deacetylase
MLDPDRPIVQSMCQAARQNGTHTVMFATDAGWLQRGGFECVLFGPGSIEVAHKPNESLSAEEFRRGGAILDALIAQRCTQQ